MSKIIYILLSYGIQGLNILLNLIFIQRLSPILLGDIAIAKIWLQAFDYGHLGTRFALDRYLPITKAGQIQKGFLYISLAVLSIMTIILISIMLCIEKNNIIILIFVSIGICLSYMNIFKAYYRAKGNIKKVNQLIFNCYFFPLLLSVIGLYYSFKVFLFIYPISFILMFLFMIRTPLKNIKPKEISLKKSKNRKLIMLISMWNVSKLLLLHSVIMYLFLTIDRIFVDNYLGRESLGKYSVIMFVFASLFTVPSILTELIFPKIVYEVKNKRKIFFAKETAIVFSGTILAIIFTDIIMKWLLTYTEYSNLYDLMILCSLGIIPYSFTSIMYHIINALDLRKSLIISSTIILIFYSISLYLLNILNINNLESIILVKVVFSFILLIGYLLTIIIGIRRPINC
ncbi:hypothetical protein AB7W11_16845 [Providencia manganoxydans]|uniref:hypothetical protein n=1 Tax=Providencia manganoxydans TaxID=2923283 RepID=UPI0034E396A2